MAFFGAAKSSKKGGPPKHYLFWGEGVPKKNFFFWGGAWGWRTNERPGSDHVTSGSIRGLKKNCTIWRKHPDRHSDGYGNSMTESAQWGRFSENPRHTH